MTTITTSELTTALSTARRPLLLEALPAKSYDDGHLPGAVQVDMKTVVEQARSLGAATDTPIVVYCASATCPNSHVAAGALERAGFTQVRVYADGKAGWTDAGHALSR